MAMNDYELLCRQLIAARDRGDMVTMYAVIGRIAAQLETFDIEHCPVLDWQGRQCTLKPGHAGMHSRNDAGVELEWA